MWAGTECHFRTCGHEHKHQQGWYDTIPVLPAADSLPIALASPIQSRRHESDERGEVVHGVLSADAVVRTASEWQEVVLKLDILSAAGGVHARRVKEVRLWKSCSKQEVRVKSQTLRAASEAMLVHFVVQRAQTHPAGTRSRLTE